MRTLYSFRQAVRAQRCGSGNRSTITKRTYGLYKMQHAVKNMQSLLTLDQMNPESRTMLPKVAFTGFTSRYSPPTLDEGFVDITKVDFEVRLNPLRSNGKSHECHLLTRKLNSSLVPRSRRLHGRSSGFEPMLDEHPVLLKVSRTPCTTARCV